MSEKIELKIAVLTISDTRNFDNDSSGDEITQQLQQEVTRKIVKDDILEIQKAIKSWPDFDVIICNGGTGIAKRDVTFEALSPFISQEIPGFGELFRMLSFQDIGSHAIASRATAFFTKQDQLIFALPGSTAAVKLAMEEIINKEVYHLIKERRK
ncbi:MogA/MoaB family molybdenum cofactor biosynthesis protein [Lactococcus termiticola]|uniref:Molybdenum cofactor biosynthesis protein B n=1 Tax=Lactococcus termiticola TaxID=2169526 RepID=A0A2R5HJG1_9LACT|nr:molybdenum cofactor biosynthesis protein B [Lactococcus termiticola]GBG96720.1 molybdenum cofactor biosynthesis protein B [Lactococcus termiticola]